MVISKILNRFRRPAKVEHIMEDEHLGKLTWNDKYSGWRGIIALANGKTAAFTIDIPETDESIPEAARNTVNFLIANEPRISYKIAVSMSEFYNRSWGNGDTLTPEEMAQRLPLTDISIWDEGGAELYYQADDELFTDHTICVSMDANGEISEPELEG